MSIREIVKNGKKVGYDVQVSARHPITREKKYLRRVAPNKWEANLLEQALKNELSEILNGSKVPSWTELVQEYLDGSLQYKAGSTRVNELSIISSHLNPQLERKLLKDICKADVDEILNRIRDTHSQSTLHNVRKTLSNIARFAIDRRYIRDNPCSGVKLKKIKRKVPELLSEKQIQLFLNKAEKYGIDWFPIWAFGIYTGLRSGELYALRFKHLLYDQDKGVVLVEEAWSKTDGFKDVKDEDYRTIPINKSLQKVIEKIKQSRPGKIDPEDFVLPRIPAWKQGDAAKELRAFLRGCDLPGIRFHDLRSCFITQLLRKGVSPSVVMTMTGHEKMETMMDYCRMVGSEVLNQTDVLDYSTDESDDAEEK
jgi:integrase